MGGTKCYGSCYQDTGMLISERPNEYLSSELDEADGGGSRHPSPGTDQEGGRERETMYSQIGDCLRCWSPDGMDLQ